MKLPVLLTVNLALALVPGALGYPGMQETMANLTARGAEDGDSTELLGDLLTLPDKKLTRVGKDIKKLLTGGGDPESDTRYTPPPKSSKECKKDTCCIWAHIANEMAGFMRGQSGRCTKWARFAVRLGFHDAGTWSKATASTDGSGGGADGSIILSGEELSRAENRGLEEVGAKFREMYDRYRDEGWHIGMADLIQLGANVGAVVCPLGPRTRTFVGREDSAEPAPDGLLPDVHADADSLISLFRDKTIGPNGLAALVGAHTTSQQHFVDPARAGDPQDTTPGVWDVRFYSETTGRVPKRVFKFPSDVALSKHPETAPEWEEFADRKSGQEYWNEHYAREYIRLSLLGVNNINKLKECTKALPPATRSFSPPDRTLLNKWLKSGDRKSKKAKKIAADLFNGKKVVDNIET